MDAHTFSIGLRSGLSGGVGQWLIPSFSISSLVFPYRAKDYIIRFSV